jgi:hypothetical protein
MLRPESIILFLAVMAICVTVGIDSPIALILIAFTTGLACGCLGLGRRERPRADDDKPPANHRR